MSKKLPSEPELRESFIKYIFINKGVSPDIVDNMDLRELQEIIEIDNQKENVAKIKKAQEEHLKVLNSGTFNQSQNYSGYE